MDSPETADIVLLQRLHVLARELHLYVILGVGELARSVEPLRLADRAPTELLAMYIDHVHHDYYRSMSR